MRYTYINLTPHCVRISQRGKLLEFEPSGKLLRLPRIVKGVGYEDGIEVVKTNYQDLRLPPKKKGTLYIVSTLVLEYIKRYHPDREDFRAPDAGYGGAMRSSSGKVYAVKRWVKSGRMTSNNS